MINDLITNINQILGIVVMIFADDIGIISDTKSALIEAIQLIDNWCTKNKMELNKQKC